ncbi:His-Xaa-Ser system protein HxsD [Candidatus Woesearchaeota archaeon]|nr:His-Xaa-Ser system protein HxsD [Candidatus Woesearchaeota archaeon]
MDENNKKTTYDGDSAVLKINPKIYPLDVIYSAAYIMIDKAYIILDGDPEKEISVNIQRKEDGQELKKIVQEFNEELLNYAVYKSQSEKNKELREAILKRVLLTNEVLNCLEEIKKEKIPENRQDPEMIFKRWEGAENDSRKQSDIK